MSKFETVHGAWHVNVREHHPDVATAFKYRYGLVGVGGFNDLKAGSLDRFDSG